MSKTLKPFILTALLLCLSFFISQEAKAGPCANVPLSGNYNVTTSCYFSGTVNGIENGNLIVDSGKTLTINAGQTIVWNPGRTVLIHGAIAINVGSPGGQLRKAYLWLIDQDDDGYPSTSTQIASASQPANGKRRSDSSFTNKFTYVGDTIVDSNDNDHCSIHLCGEDQDGVCVPLAAGEQGLPACQRCDGVSLDVVNITDNTGDSEGSNLCNATSGDCYRCLSGSCTYQTDSQDLWDQCAQGTTTDVGCGTGYCNGTDYVCGIMSTGDGNCPVCYRCTDSDIACEYYATDTHDDTGCTGCNWCDGSGNCLSCYWSLKVTYTSYVADQGPSWYCSPSHDGDTGTTPGWNTPAACSTPNYDGWYYWPGAGGCRTNTCHCVSQ